MIRIPLSEKQKENVENIYWDWFSKYHLKNMINIVRNDDVMKKLISIKKIDIEEDMKAAIKVFLLSDYNELESIKERIDEEKKVGKLKKNTKDYLLARYKNYRDSQAGKIINALELTVCPYCNQNHINVVHEKGKRIRFWGDLDHFYDKSTYPELSICLYNMIPVCKVCNQLKASQKRKIVNPYNTKVKSHIKFITEFDDKLDLNYLQGKTKNFNIAINKNEITVEDEEEIELFDLENRYKSLKQNAQEIILKARAYDEIYQNQLKTEFGIEAKELMSYIFGYTDNHLDRVLSKFNLDIMNEFKNED